jgi:hypothetical protein
MYGPRFRLKSFETISHGYKIAVLEHLLEALTAACAGYLLTFPHTPRLYESGVVYEEEPPGRDEWQDTPDTIARRNGDCEDLACWRMAELRVYGEDKAARWHITVADIPDERGELVTTYHIQILRSAPGPHTRPGARGEPIEDPSRILGMHG